jgi:hypothetical protein
MEPGRPDGNSERGTRSPDAPTAEDRKRFTRVLTDALTSPDIQAVPAHLSRACVDLLDVSGASVSLSGGPGLRTLWWSSDHLAWQLAEAQYSLGDGPCHSAVRQVAPVLAGDLTRGPDARRWPVFAQRAVELGVQAVFSLPLGTGAVAIGTLDLYREQPGSLTGRDLSFVFPAGDAISAALMKLQSGSAGQGGDDATSWLDAAETEHEEVHYATGMLMVTLGVDPQDALARLRAYAFAQGLTVTEVAREVIADPAKFDD